MLKVQKPLPKTLAKKAKNEFPTKHPRLKVKEAKPENQPLEAKEKTKKKHKELVPPKKPDTPQKSAKEKEKPLDAKEKTKKKHKELVPPKKPDTPQKSAKEKKTKFTKLQKDKSDSKDAAGTPLNKLQKKKAAKRAFKQQQLKKKSGKKQKQQPANPLPMAPFDEEKFNAIVNVDNIKKIAKALKKVVEEQVAAQKTNIFSDYRYLLNVASFKIPNCPKRMVKLNLKHSLVDKDDDVLMIVPDLQRGAKIDHDSTKQHYEDIFREAGIEGLTIMPFNQLRNEYKTFETVRKLGNTYDYFLCDGRLVGQVTGFCGKALQKPRTTVHSVRLEKLANLKNEVTKALRRTAYKQLAKGDLISIPVGTHNHKADQLAENVEYVVSQLRKLYAGGLGNVRNMTLKIDIAGTPALPLYVSAGQAPDQTPYIVGPREQRLLKLKKDANEVLSKFTMTKEANIIKLDKSQIERKRKIREARAVLAATPSTDVVIGDQTKTPEELPVRKSSKKVKHAADTELQPVDKSDGEEPVPKKKPRLEKDVDHKIVTSPDDSDDDDDVQNVAGAVEDSSDDDDIADEEDEELSDDGDDLENGGESDGEEEAVDDEGEEENNEVEGDGSDDDDNDEDDDDEDDEEESD